MNPRRKKIIIATGVLGVSAFFVIGFVVVAAVTGYRAALHAGYEAATLQNLKTIAAVEVQYFNNHNRTFATFDQLITEQLLSRKFAGEPVAADGYVFNLAVARKPDGSSFYKLTADLQHGTSMRHFYFDSDGNGIHGNPDRQ